MNQITITEDFIYGLHSFVIDHNINKELFQQLMDYVKKPGGGRYKNNKFYMNIKSEEQKERAVRFLRDLDIESIKMSKEVRSIFEVFWRRDQGNYRLPKPNKGTGYLAHSIKSGIDILNIINQLDASRCVAVNTKNPLFADQGIRCVTTRGLTPKNLEGCQVLLVSNCSKLKMSSAFYKKLKTLSKKLFIIFCTKVELNTHPMELYPALKLVGAKGCDTQKKFQDLYLSFHKGKYSLKDTINYEKINGNKFSNKRQ